MAKKKFVEKGDPLDQGVPVLASDVGEDRRKLERQGPEDALGFGPKRGDYSNRLGGALPHTAVRVETDEKDEAGNYISHTVLVDQSANLEEIGDEPGLKGGVQTHSDQGMGEKALGLGAKKKDDK